MFYNIQSWSNWFVFQKKWIIYFSYIIKNLIVFFKTIILFSFINFFNLFFSLWISFLESASVEPPAEAWPWADFLLAELDFLFLVTDSFCEGDYFLADLDAFSSSGFPPLVLAIFIFVF